MWASEVDFQQSEVPYWVEEGQEDQKATWFFAAASGRYSLCGNVSEAVGRIMRQHNVPVAMKPYKTLKNVYSGTSKRQTGQGRLNRMCVQSSLCKLWQDLDRRNWKEVSSQITGTQDSSEIQNRTHIHSLRASSLTEHNKSALTDHATEENHVINWSQATVIDREPDSFTRWIKEAIHIRKEGKQAMNRDEGSFQLSHMHIRPLSWHGDGVFP